MRKQIVKNTCNQFDFWLRSNKIETRTFYDPSKLGFKYLNDLLSFKLFSDIKEDFLSQKFKRIHGKLINTSSSYIAFFVKYDFQYFLKIIQPTLLNLPSITEFENLQLKRYKPSYLQNLYMLFLSLERWNKSFRIEKNILTDKILIGEKGESLYSILSNELGKFNTLESLVLNSFSFPAGIKKTSTQGNIKILVESKSKYTNIKSKVDRFPTLTNVEPFFSLMKKGEICSYAYNKEILRLASILINDSSNIKSIAKQSNKITDLLHLINSEIETFLTTSKFSYEEFIFTLRQYTIEINPSPIELFFKEELERGKYLRIKSLLISYCSKTQLSKKESKIFVREILKNEGLSENRIKKIFEIEGIISTRKIKKVIKGQKVHSDINVLSECIVELLSQSMLGISRIKYALLMIVSIYPELKIKIDTLLNNSDKMSKIIVALNAQPYQLAPSGANSMAFYSLDFLLGYSNKLHNYLIHILNRIEYMSEKDRTSFWNYQNIGTVSLTKTLKKYIKETLSSEYNFTKNFDSADEDLIYTLLKEKPLVIQILKIYYEFSRYTQLHSRLIMKYLHTSNKKLQKDAKSRLVSKPDHGTTFMTGKNKKKSDCRTQLPSIRELNNNRIEHPFVKYIDVIISKDELRKHLIKSEKGNQYDFY